MSENRFNHAIPANAETFEDILDACYLGDCLEGMDVIPDETVDLVFADPPYNIGIEYEDHDDYMTPESYLYWCGAWITQATRILKPGGSLWIAISDEYVSEISVLAKGRYSLGWSPHDDIHRLGGFGKDAKLSVPLIRRHHVIWYYTFGVNCKKKLTRSHTHLLHFVKQDDHKWNGDTVRIPSWRQMAGDKRANPDGRLPDDTWIIAPAGMELFASGDDTWHCPRIAGTFKARVKDVPTQIPEQLAARIIRLCTDPNDVVVDPFSGSGTTLAVAKKLKRHYIGFEMSLGYHAQSLLRLQSIQQGDMIDKPDIQDVAKFTPPRLPRKRPVV